MAQIPALFLPKKSSEKKSQSKEQKQEKKPVVPKKKVSALLKGRVDGHKENSQTYRTTRRREC